MANSKERIDYLLGQLIGLEDVTAKNMFGGTGFFKDGLMFGMLGSDIFRLKVNESNKAAFESAGMKPYQNSKKGKGMPYWEVPSDVIENSSELCKWAGKAFLVALETKK